MSKSKSLTVAFAIPISTRSVPSGRGRFTPACRVMKLWGVAVGDQVEKYAPGDLVGVGCIVDSCKHCEECEDGLENYCDHMTGTYNSPTPDEPGHTLGGYSQQIVAFRQAICSAYSSPARAVGGGGSFVVCRDHHVFAATSLAGRAG